MGKRVTVRMMLKKRLSEAKRLLAYQPTYTDLTNVMGGYSNPVAEDQYETNLKNDIDQLEFLLDRLNDYGSKR